MQPQSNNPPSHPPAVGAAPPSVPGSNVPNSEVIRRDFLWKTHDYTNNYVRFADTKAAFIIALTSGLLAGLLGAKAHHYCSPYRLNLREPAWIDSWLGISALLAFSFLILGFCCGMLTIAPRLWNKLVKGLLDTLKHLFSKKVRANTIEPGFLYWSSILAHKTPEDFYNALSSQSEDDLSHHLADHLYVLAGIAEEKFLYVDRSIRFALLGGIIAALFILASS